MSEYLVAPDGRAQFARWRCFARCPAEDYSMTGDEAREQAAAHVRETGHTVRVERGTAEWLHGMAQALPPRLELMPAGCPYCGNNDASTDAEPCTCSSPCGAKWCESHRNRSASA